MWWIQGWYILVVMLASVPVWAAPPVLLVTPPPPCSAAVAPRQENANAVIYSARQTECPPQNAANQVVLPLRPSPSLTAPVILRVPPQP